MTLDEQLQDYLAGAPDFGGYSFEPTPWTSEAIPEMAAQNDLNLARLASGKNQDVPYTPFQSTWNPADNSLAGRGNYPEYLQQFKDAGMVSPTSFTDVIDKLGKEASANALLKEQRTDLETGTPLVTTKQSPFSFHDVGGSGILFNPNTGEAKTVIPSNHTTPEQKTIEDNKKREETRAYTALKELDTAANKSENKLRSIKAKLIAIPVDTTSTELKDQKLKLESALVAEKAIQSSILRQKESLTNSTPMFQAQKPVQFSPQTDTFNSEAEARSAGYGANSVVKINGVGKVRLR